MTTSVLIIAHNEERYIRRCIESVLDQTQAADEIVLITHNCTDGTERIAREYPITVIPYEGPSGIIHARIKGFECVSGDIILCTDGDSYVARNWVKVMSALLREPGRVFVGSWIRFKGTLSGWCSNFFNKIRTSKQERIERMIWGPSMALWGKDRTVVQDILRRSAVLTDTLGLSRNPDDYWLALFMKRRGALALTDKTHATQYTKETTSGSFISRTRENVANAQKMEAYMNSFIE